MAELGQTTDPKELIPGEPELISGDLRELIGNITTIDRTGGQLGRVDPAQWTGEASDAFRVALGAEPPKWIRAVENIGGGGQVLADFGDVLAWGQGQAQQAIELYTQAQAASRAAAAQYNLQAQNAAAAGQALAPFQDPGQAAAQSAQAILATARGEVAAVGDQVASRLGFEPDGQGGYERSFGADNRRKTWDEEKKEWVDKDGWQRNRFGASYGREWGSQPDALFGDKIAETLEALGIDIPEKTWGAGADVELLGGSLDGSFESGLFSGKGELSGSLLGAGAEAHAGLSALGLTAGASAEAYLAKGSAEGELNVGEHAGVSGSAEGMVGARAEAEGTLGWTGGEAQAGAFVGARAAAEGNIEVAGVNAGMGAEAWAGAGVEASGQFGMGDDGKFHVGGSLGVGFGVGGKLEFDVAIDPGEVVDTVQDVASDVGEVASDVGEAVGDAASAVGEGVADAAGAVGDVLGF